MAVTGFLIAGEIVMTGRDETEAGSQAAPRKTWETPLVIDADIMWDTASGIQATMMETCDGKANAS